MQLSWPKQSGRAEGQGEAKQDLHDEHGPELAVVGVHLEGAGRGVTALAGDDAETIGLNALLGLKAAPLRFAWHAVSIPVRFRTRTIS